MTTHTKKEIAVFGGGCFWCTEAVFEELEGVLSVTSGYAGGSMENPSYDDVSTGRTGHAEVTRIEYDPDKISYQDLLTVFFYTHDPTTLNRQGADVGEQYRSMILYTNETQKNLAESFIKELTDSKAYKSPIVTEVKPLGNFFEAEDYHQNYYKNNPDKPYCQVVIAPKVEKLRARFKNLLRKTNIL
jgi:peptide-methionine (S)-S-oxide reductase